MRQIILQLLVLLLILASGCGKFGIKSEEETNFNVSFEDFLALFPPQSSGISEINAKNGLDFRESPEIETAYFQSFLQANPYLNHLSDKLTFSKNTTDNQEVVYRVVMDISSDPHFHSLIISANLEGDPTHEWEYYLLHYAKDGSYIDGILLSYRNSYVSEEAIEKVFQSEYRYVSFLPNNQLHFTDVSYDNTVKSSVLKDEKPLLLTKSGDSNAQYFRESWYQIEEKGTFKHIKTVERNKDDAEP
jgi:hypothetical protein